MDKLKETDEKGVAVELTHVDFLEELTQATNRIIADAGEQATREAEQELKKFISEYERKTKQITLKIKEETKAKTAEIAAKFSEAVMLRIEQASAKAVTDAVSELSNRAGEVTLSMQDITQKAADHEKSKISTSLRDNVDSIDKNSLQEEVDIPDIVNEEESRQDSKSVTGEENKKLNQSIEAEDFDRWLTE
jgi:hypothetical protein